MGAVHGQFERVLNGLWTHGAGSKGTTAGVGPYRRRNVRFEMGGERGRRGTILKLFEVCAV